jgi:uncharacterized protein (PEP-CTERM system associated)
MRAIVHRGVKLGASVVAVAAASAHAQTATVSEDTEGRSFSIVPTLFISETLSNNVLLSSNDRRSDLVSQVTPGIRINSTGGRFRGFLDYSLSGIAYARNSRGNEFQNALNSALSVEAIEKFAFVDVTANVSQQVISAYGTRSADSTVINSNRTEVANFSISPYATGRLAGLADYEARFRLDWTRNSTTETADSARSLALLRVTGDSDGHRVSWSADASHQAYDYKEGRRTEDDRIRGVLYIPVNPQLRFSLIAGIESSNMSTLEKETESTPGAGVDWSPTERTRLSGQYEKRFFGNSHSLIFEHRTPRTVWRFSDVQDIVTSFGQPIPGQFGTAYNLYFEQFASVQPDPVLRGALVDEFLRVRGIDPTAQLFSGSLATSPTRERRQNLSFALLGVRDTITFSASQTRGIRIDPLSTAIDDFANDNLVRQRGLSVSLAHLLTPVSALNLVGSFDRTSGSTTAQSTTLRSVSLFLTGQFGPRGGYSLEIRHSSFSSSSNPYSETAATATLALRF